MIEVFRTNVKQQAHARMLISHIHQTFIGYQANFDLQDCDKILRVNTGAETIQSSRLVDLLKHFGFHAEVLPDTPQPVSIIIPCGHISAG